MGSSSKKVKSSKESRKRRHRSRSASDEETKERERHRHRKHHHRERRHEKRERHKEYESDESTGQTSPPQIHTVDSSPEESRGSTPPNDHKSSDSLSIEETNKLRAKLGLKPLEVSSKEVKPSKSRGSKGEEHQKIKDDLGEFYHKPAISLAEKAKQEKLRGKLQVRKEKRKIEGKLMKVKALGESDTDDDVSNWVERNRKIQTEKEQAAKRAKMLEELDAEFGVGDIVESETKLKRAKIYGNKNLTGLRVEHNPENFVEGKNVILTLKDAEVLGEDEDVLVNVNMIDDERYNKSNEIKKKKPGYQAYDDEEYDQYGNIKPKTLLGKYDEEIDGAKKDSFTIGQNTAAEHRRLTQSVKEKLSNKRLESLVLPELNLASEYYTEAEMVKFKKPKKRVKKLRPKAKVLSALELAASLKEENIGKDLGSRKRPKMSENHDSEPSGSRKVEMSDWMDIDDVADVKNPTMEDLKLEQDDTALELALRKARRLKQKENLTFLPSVTSLIKDEPVEDQSLIDSGHIILNSTAEFCRTLGDIPTYGRSGNRDEEKDLLDFDRDLKLSPPTSPVPKATNAWNPVDPTDPLEARNAPNEAPILDEEPDVGAGVGAALKLAMSKGYLDKEENNRPSTSRFAHLQAKHYSIEDKTYGDDDKFGGGNRRERHNGPTQDFRERDGFRPNVKLEYIDDDGRVLNAKEAFRYLSHKFHGKGPGKNKIEKRIKKSDQEVLMKKMSSTDTPLGTLNMLQHKQKEMQSPFIVLSGSKHTHTTSISKARR